MPLSRKLVHTVAALTLTAACGGAQAGCLLGFLPPCTLDREGGLSTCEETCDVTASAVEAVTYDTRRYRLTGRCYFRAIGAAACPPADAPGSWTFRGEWNAKLRSATESVFRRNWDGQDVLIGNFQTSCDMDPWINQPARCNDEVRPASARRLTAQKKQALCGKVLTLLVPSIRSPQSSQKVSSPAVVQAHVYVPECGAEGGRNVVVALEKLIWPGAPGAEEKTVPIALVNNFALKTIELGPGNWSARARVSTSGGGVWSNRVTFEVNAAKAYDLKPDPVFKPRPQVIPLDAGSGGE